MDICSICGPVESIPVGWGFMCSKRAAELNWKNMPVAPQPLCPVCKSRHLDNMGACPSCDAPLPRYDQRPGQEWNFEDDLNDAGLYGRDEFMDLPDTNAPPEQAVFGWKTLGRSDVDYRDPFAPPLVRTEYAALHGGNK